MKKIVGLFLFVLIIFNNCFALTAEQNIAYNNAAIYIGNLVPQTYPGAAMLAVQSCIIQALNNSSPAAVSAALDSLMNTFATSTSTAIELMSNLQGFANWPCQYQCCEGGSPATMYFWVGGDSCDMYATEPMSTCQGNWNTQYLNSPLPQKDRNPYTGYPMGCP